MSDHFGTSCIKKLKPSENFLAAFTRPNEFNQSNLTHFLIKNFSIEFNDYKIKLAWNDYVKQAGSVYNINFIVRKNEFGSNSGCNYPNCDWSVL